MLKLIVLSLTLHFSFFSFVFFKNMLPLESDNSGKGDWYSEVLDLRRKAAEYRRRAQNTHFCADHMAQLLSDETQLWEHASSDTPSPTENYLKNIRPAGITYNKY